MGDLAALAVCLYRLACFGPCTNARVKCIAKCQHFKLLSKNPMCPSACLNSLCEICRTKMSIVLLSACSSMCYCPFSPSSYFFFSPFPMEFTFLCDKSINNNCSGPQLSRIPSTGLSGSLSSLDCKAAWDCHAENHSAPPAPSPW